MNCKKMIALTAALLSIAVTRSGHTQSGIVEFEIPFNVTTEFIECLGEAIEASFTVKVRTQYIELQTGQTHFVENWFLDGTARGVTSGFTWYARGPSPFVSNAHGVQMTNTLVANVTFEPLDGGQKFGERLRMQVVVDNNGVPRVDTHQHLRWRCIGN